MFGLENKKGFSLTEVIVSAVILGIVVISLLGVFMIGRVGSAKAKHRTKAMNLIRARMEWIKGQGYLVVDGWRANPLPDEHDIDDAVGTDELLNDVRITRVIKDAGNNLVVTVTIDWDEKRWLGTDRQQEELVTLISP